MPEFLAGAGVFGLGVMFGVSIVTNVIRIKTNQKDDKNG